MMKLENAYGTSVIRLVLGVVLLAAASSRQAAAEGPSLKKPSLENSDPNGVIQWTRKIYEDGKWNATPDIVHWKGHYYVCINQGPIHNGLDDPVIVLRSSDLKEWEHIYTTTGPPENGAAVDCKFVALPDRLILTYQYMDRPGGTTPALLAVAQNSDDRNYVETRVVYTEDGKHWSESQRVHEPLHNFWKAKVRDGVMYVASDYVNVGRTDYVLAREERNSKLFRIDLVSSTDGLEWKKVSTILKDPPWSITETALTFRPDGELWALTRQNFLSRSRPPYKEWTTESAELEGGGVGGPEMIAIGDDVYLAGRYYGYLANHGPPDSPQTDKFATSLWKFNHAAGKFKRIADLPRPCFADMGYAAFVQTKDGVFVVHYSGHAYEEANLARGHYNEQTDIYLSKLKLGE